MNIHTRGPQLPAFSVAASTAIAIGVAAGTGVAGVYGAHKMADATTQAADTQTGFDEKALDYQKSQDALSRGDYLYERQIAMDRYNALQDRLKPYRAAGAQTVGNLTNLLNNPNAGVDFHIAAPPGPVSGMTKGAVA